MLASGRNPFMREYYASTKEKREQHPAYLGYFYVFYKHPERITYESLHYAVENNQSRLVRYIIKNTPPNYEPKKKEGLVFFLKSDYRNIRVDLCYFLRMCILNGYHNLSIFFAKLCKKYVSNEYIEYFEPFSLAITCKRTRLVKSMYELNFRSGNVPNLLVLSISINVPELVDFIIEKFSCVIYLHYLLERSEVLYQTTDQGINMKIFINILTLPQKFSVFVYKQEILKHVYHSRNEDRKKMLLFYLKEVVLDTQERVIKSPSKEELYSALNRPIQNSVVEIENCLLLSES